MKNLLLILIMLFVCELSTSCSGGDESTSTPTVVNKTIPNELIGDWEIKILTLATDPNYYDGNSIGAYIKFKSDGTIEYLDGSIQNSVVTYAKPEQVSGSLNDMIQITVNNRPQSIQCRIYNKSQNQVSFTIRYGTGSPHYDMLMIGKKK